MNLRFWIASAPSEPRNDGSPGRLCEGDNPKQSSLSCLSLLRGSERAVQAIQSLNFSTPSSHFV